MGFEQNSRKNHILIQFPKLPVRPVTSEFFQAPTVEYLKRKRSQNHCRLHFSSKTPYSFDTRGILSTPVCDVHGRKQSDAKEILTNNQDENKYNSMKHLKGEQFLCTMT